MTNEMPPHVDLPDEHKASLDHAQDGIQRVIDKSFEHYREAINALLRILVLINGGGVITVFAMLGNIAQHDPDRGIRMVGDLRPSVILFCTGIGLSALILIGDMVGSWLTFGATTDLSVDISRLRHGTADRQLASAQSFLSVSAKFQAYERLRHLPFLITMLLLLGSMAMFVSGTLTAFAVVGAKH